MRKLLSGCVELYLDLISDSSFPIELTEDLYGLIMDIKKKLDSCYYVCKTGYVIKYDPGQPRGENGRWIDAGGSSGGASGGGDKLVSTGGIRNEDELTEQQITNAMNYAIKLGMPAERIRYGSGYYTSYGSNFDMLYLGTDVYPSKNPKCANGRLSYRASVAHEIIGHRESCQKGTDQNNLLYDEIQASIRAAKFAPDLSKTERICLLRDAGERAHKNGIKLKDIKNKLDIYER